MEEKWIGLLVAAAGLFAIAGAVFNWDFFMNNRKARLFVSLLGRNGARVVYVILGGIIITLGALIALGFLKNGQGA